MEASGFEMWHRDIHINKFVFCRFPWLIHADTHSRIIAGSSSSCWQYSLIHHCLNRKLLGCGGKTGSSCLGSVSVEDPVGFQMADRLRKPSSQIHAWTFVLAGDFTGFLKLILLTMQTWLYRENNWGIWSVGWVFHENLNTDGSQVMNNKDVTFFQDWTLVKCEVKCLNFSGFQWIW